MTAAELVAARIAEAGCKHAFGIPGGEVLSLMRALDAAGVAFTLVKHENAGGFMAEGTHHAAALSEVAPSEVAPSEEASSDEASSDEASSGSVAPARTPGVLLATIGPGLANAVNAAANAKQEQTPLLILAGSVAPAEAASYTHQVLDQAALMREACKASISLADGAVDILIDRAVTLAMEDPMGPVHVDLPVSLADTAQPPARRYRAPAPGPGRPDLAALRAAQDRLAAAERPVILAGMGAMQQDAGPALIALAEHLGAPVLTTYKAKGVIPESHPLSLGGHGLSPKSDGIVLPLLAAADCILSVGYDPIEMRAGWIDPFPPERHIALLHAQAHHGMHGAGLALIGALPMALQALLDGFETGAGPRERSRTPPKAAGAWPCGRAAEARAALEAAFAPPPGWGPHQAFAAAQAASPAETIVTADSGAHRILLSQQWKTPAPRHLLQSAAFCTMGVALPLAMGVKRAAPERPVLAVMGDAGLEMVLGELATLRDWRVGGFCILVMVDESLSLIALKQERAGQAPLGVDFGGTNWPEVAAALGGVGAWADSADDVKHALHDGFAQERRFSLIAARVAKADYDGAF
ncbi:MAG: thiamine pyrophosphate-binding protein [Pseudomonadota bacterium]